MTHDKFGRSSNRLRKHPIEPFHVASKKYVDDTVEAKLKIRDGGEKSRNDLELLLNDAVRRVRYEIYTRFNKKLADLENKLNDAVVRLERGMKSNVQGGGNDLRV